MAYIKNEDFKNDARNFPKYEHETTWNHNQIPMAYNTKTEEEQEGSKFFCAVCEHSAYSIEAYQEHVVSQEHISRAARVFHLDIPSKKQLKDENKDRLVQHCDICEVNCSGESSWIAHITGSKHKKKAKMRKAEAEATEAAKGKTMVRYEDTEPLQETLNELFEHPEPIIGLEFVVEIHVPNGGALKYECEVCEAKFDGNVKFSHLTGVKHRHTVIKFKNRELYREISKIAEKRSEYGRKCAQAAKEMEESEGRKKIRAKRQYFVTIERAASPPSDVKRELPRMYQGNSASPRQHDEPEDEEERDAKLTQPYFRRDYDERPRSESRERFRGRSPTSPPPPREEKPGSVKSNRSPRRYSPPSKRARSPTNSAGGFRDRSRSPQSSRQFPSPPRFPNREREQSGSPGGRDIADEIQEEIRRQKRRQEEERRREDRRRRHQKREEEERREAETRKKREKENPRGPDAPMNPMNEVRSIDEDTRRLVMQNLTELAKCCVTNEADAELALQVSNALTQALLQYRMRNMPQSNQPGGTQGFQQQAPPGPPGPPGPPNNPPGPPNFSQPFQAPPQLPQFNNSPMTPQNNGPLPFQPQPNQMGGQLPPNAPSHINQPNRPTNFPPNQPQQLPPFSANQQQLQPPQQQQPFNSSHSFQGGPNQQMLQPPGASNQSPRHNIPLPSQHQQQPPQHMAGPLPHQMNNNPPPPPNMSGPQGNNMLIPVNNPPQQHIGIQGPPQNMHNNRNNNQLSPINQQHPQQSQQHGPHHNQHNPHQQNQPQHLGSPHTPHGGPQHSQHSNSNIMFNSHQQHKAHQQQNLNNHSSNLPPPPRNQQIMNDMQMQNQLRGLLQQQRQGNMSGGGNNMDRPPYNHR